MRQPKKAFQFEGKEYDYKGLQELAYERYNNVLNLTTIQKRISRKWPISKVISTSNNYKPITIKNSILNMFLLEHNLTQQSVAKNTEVSLVTLAKLVSETEFTSRFGVKTLKSLASASHLTIAQVVNELMYASDILHNEELTLLDLSNQLEQYIDTLPYTKYVDTEYINDGEEIDIKFKVKNFSETTDIIVALTKNNILSFNLTINGILKSFVPFIDGNNININLQKTFNQVLNKVFLQVDDLSFPSLTPLKMLLSTHGYTPKSFIDKMNLSPTYFSKAEKLFSLKPSLSINMVTKLAEGLNVSVPDLLDELRYAIELCNNKDNTQMIKHFLSVINRNPFIDFISVVEYPNNIITFQIKYCSFNVKNQTSIDIKEVKGKDNNGGSLMELSNGMWKKEFVPVNYNLELNLINSLD